MFKLLPKLLKVLLSQLRELCRCNPNCTINHWHCIERRILILWAPVTKSVVLIYDIEGNW